VQEAKANPRKLTGEVDLSLCSTKDEKVHDKRFVFCIVTARYNIYLEAASHEEMLGWMCSIDEVKMVQSMPAHAHAHTHARTHDTHDTCTTDTPRTHARTRGA
jgi:hypothetical protein